MRNTTRNLLFLSTLLATASCGGSKSPGRAVGYPSGPAESPADYAVSTVSAESEAPMAERTYADVDDAPGAPAAASGDSYEHVAENQYASSKEQAFSTFSIDVDTASYANVRRFLKSGHLPPAGAVRIEEFVNYFGYDYADPTDGTPFAVHSELSKAPWNPDHELLRIGLQGERMDASELPRRNLVFLIDVSGSMSSHDKLPLLREGFKMLTQTLGEDDFVSIVVYAGAAGAVLLPTSGADQESIMSALDELQSGGSTNGGQGIQLAYKLAEQNFQPNAINRVILASDGDFNVGMTNKQALIELVEAKRKSGVYLSVLGFGRGNLRDATMEQIADKGNGNYSYIDSASEAKKVLVDEGGSTLITIAKDVKVQVEFNPEAVAGYRLIGYENRMLAKEDFDNDAVDAGELGPGHSVTALYEIEPAKGRRAGSVASVKLRYKRPDSNKSELIHHRITSEGGAFEKASRDMRFATSVAGFGLLLRDSQYKGTLTWSVLAAMAEDAVGNHPSPHRQELLDLIGRARKLAGPKAELAR